MENNTLSVALQSSDLEPQTAVMLNDKFEAFFAQAAEWETTAKTLVVTSVDQKAEMQQAREARLALRAIRTDAEKTRKALKEDSLRYGKAVQTIYNVIENKIKPIEEYLEQQEKFAEIQYAIQKATLKADRLSELQPYSAFVPLGIDLAGMSAESYELLLNGAMLQHQAKQEADRKAEAARIEQAKAEAEAREFQRLENIKLKAEAERVAKEREAERKANEEKLAEERRANEEKLAEERAKAKAEAARIADENNARIKVAREAKAAHEAQLREGAADIQTVVFAEFLVFLKDWATGDISSGDTVNHLSDFAERLGFYE